MNLGFFVPSAQLIEVSFGRVKKAVKIAVFHILVEGLQQRRSHLLVIITNHQNMTKILGICF